ncbi:hypothetical protein KAK06_21440 [Ideonella sp. 4Y11]|uniref:Uncharacterized protein n=1 Tax=Ideonella aquatica TaxID=2824119 RepID=A0A940YMW2_9BURK|nr:hypothetical protein [Ideonella aquatica]MBQ0961517.1 hypothetical protein [Ideonella aquatica]
MERRHQDNLLNRLEEAWLNGVSHISWDELYHWYGVDKIAARTYRDLEDRWTALTDDKAGRLMKVEGRGGMFVFGESSAAKVDPKHVLNQI